MNRTIPLTLTVIALWVGLFGPATANNAEKTTLSALDVFELEWAEDPQIGPDEKHALYSRRGFDIMTDRTTRDVWLVAIDGSLHEPLLTGIKGLRSPRWSPRGDRIAFLASTGENQTGLFVHYLASGRTGEMASFSESPSNLTWSPNGEHIGFTMAVKSKPETLVKSPTKPEGAKWAPAPNLIERARYRTNASGFLELAYEHIFIVPAEGGTARQLTEGHFNHASGLSFSPNGEAIVFSANRHANWERETFESDIFSVSTIDGALTQLTNAPGAERSPQVSPDGKHIVYQQWDNEAQNPYIMPKIVVMHTDGSSPVTLAAGIDRRLQSPRWTSETQIIVTYHDHGEQILGLLSLDGEVKTDWATVSGTTIGRPYLSGDYDQRGDMLLFTKGSAYRPADLFVRTADGKEKQLTELNDDLLAHRQLGELRAFTYASPHDGQEIDGWMITPPDYQEGKPYPLIIEIHGGPHLSYGPHFSAELQRMAAAGYVVVYDNHRGSSGYGEDFGQLLKFKYSSKEDFADHMGAVDWAVENGFADQSNLFIAGGSAGGIATAYAVGLTDRFKAAVAAKPVINWISKTLTADSYIGQQRHQFPGPPWEHVEHYWERSPLSLVGNVSTPTMLITGELDWRTPMSETEQFYQALQLRGVPTAMVRIPGANHGIAGRPSRLNAKVDYTLAWFERYKEEK